MRLSEKNSISAITWHDIHQNLPSLFNLWTDKTINVKLCKKLRNRSQKEWPVKLHIHKYANKFEMPDQIWKGDMAGGFSASGHWL